jgi:hypothetical protein
MTRLAFVLCLISFPAFADDKPPTWVMAVQLKATTVTANYQSEARCEEAVKLITMRLKKHGLGRADCLPVLQQ